MILDNNTLFTASPTGAIPFGTATTVLDLGTTKPGNGEPIRVFLQGSTNMAGAGTVVFTTGPTNACANALMTYGKAITGAYVELLLPNTTEQFVRATLTATAGTWSAGIVLEGGQTNR